MSDRGERKRAFRIRRLVQNGYAKWASKPYNQKWVKRIEGTPIPNDLLVSIEDELRRAANLLRTEPGGEPVAYTSEDNLRELGERGGIVAMAGERSDRYPVSLYVSRPTAPVEPERPDPLLLTAALIIRSTKLTEPVDLGNGAHLDQSMLPVIAERLMERARPSAPVEEREPEEPNDG